MAAIVLLVGAAPAPVAEALCSNCINARFGFYDENLLFRYVRLDASADRGDGISSGIKSVYYEITASNDDTGWSKAFKGTDAVEGGKHWERSVYPNVEWGNLTFTYHIRVFFKDGRDVWANKVTQHYNR